MFHLTLIGGSLEESKHAAALARTQKAHADWPALFSTVGVHPTRCSEFEQNEFGNDPDKYFAHLVAVCEEGMTDGTVEKLGCICQRD